MISEITGRKALFNYLVKAEYMTAPIEMSSKVMVWGL